MKFREHVYEEKEHRSKYPTKALLEGIQYFLQYDSFLTPQDDLSPSHHPSLPIEQFANSENSLA